MSAILIKQTKAAAFATICAVAPSVCMAAGATYADPAAYCAALGTIDSPDKRYTGEPIPDWIARALMRATGAPRDAPISVFKHAEWRCADGRVMACSYGANIPCDQKADASRVPSSGARAFCAQNPGAGVVPAFAAGHATVYEWRCDGTRAVSARQVLHVDPQGYAAEFWHAIGSKGR
jgi:hypothetical protein